MLKSVTRLGATLMLLLLTGGIHAADPPVQAQVCAACHGAEAPSPFPGVPTIHGLPLAVLDNALYDFRAGIRPCRKPDCGQGVECPDLEFCAIAAQLSDEDIGVLAHWYASQDYAPVTQEWDEGMAAQGRVLHAAHCESCHAGGGMSPTEQAGILRGQPKAYLRQAMEDFRQERRVAVAEMDVVAHELSREQVDALLEFYASPLQ